MIFFFFLLKTVEYNNHNETIQAIPRITTDTMKLASIRYKIYPPAINTSVIKSAPKVVTSSVFISSLYTFQILTRKDT